MHSQDRDNSVHWGKKALQGHPPLFLKEEKYSVSLWDKCTLLSSLHRHTASSFIMVLDTYSTHFLAFKSGSLSKVSVEFFFSSKKSMSSDKLSVWQEHDKEAYSAQILPNTTKSQNLENKPYSVFFPPTALITLGICFIVLSVR